MNSEDIRPARENILVVDDVPGNLRLLMQLLSQQGYNVRIATSAKRALATIGNKKPDLILLDIQMPEVNGYQLCEVLKADNLTRDIPVIFLSALDEVIDKVKAFKVGGVDYITKPFQFEEVLARIENQLTIQRQQKALKQEIDRRKKAEESLQESRLLLASILNSSLDGIAALKAIREDGNGKISDFLCLQANPALVRVLRKEQEDLIGQPILQDFCDRFDLDLFPLLVRVVEQGEPLKHDCYCDTDVVRGWYQFIAVKLGDGFSLNLRNITEQKRLEFELERQARLDSLTQVSNRRHFDEYFSVEWQRCRRERQPLSLILCDVDYFKRYNDTYGHQAGDDCLIRVAEVLSPIAKRSTDLVARYGGEEFATILANTNLEGASKVAESIRKAVAHLKIPHRASEIANYVTLSLGVASIVPTDRSVPEDLIAAADKALYEAKGRGRDRVVVAGDKHKI